jgi:hypothetical protein
MGSWGTHSAFLPSHEDGPLLLSKTRKVPMDTRPDPTQADAHQDTVVETLEEALSKLGQEGIASASDRGTEMARSDAQQPLEVMALADLRQTVSRLAVGQQQMTRDIASLQAAKPSLHTTLPPADLKRMIGLLSDTPPPGRRASRAFTRFLIVGFIGVGGILAWQFYDEATKQTLGLTARMGAIPARAQAAARCWVEDCRTTEFTCPSGIRAGFTRSCIRCTDCSEHWRAGPAHHPLSRGAAATRGDGARSRRPAANRKPAGRRPAADNA